MKDEVSKVAVCSRSFSQHPILREELCSKFSKVKFNDEGKSLGGSDLVNFISDSEYSIVALEVINEDILKELPKLKVIGKYGVGLDKLDLVKMKEYGVQLGWTPGVNARAVAELTLGLALNIIRKIPESHNLVKNNEWKQIKGKELSSMTYGILGLGHVGKELAKLLSGFGIKILYSDIIDQEEFAQKYSLQKVSADELFKEADIVSVHIPLNDKNNNFVDAKKIGLMKKDSYLINTARGGIVDEEALLMALNQNQLMAVAFDVFEKEPPVNLELANHSKMYATTHIGGSSEEAILAMGKAAIRGLFEYRDATSYE